MKISFEHAGLYTDDLDKVIKFYKEVFGFEEIFAIAVEGVKAAIVKLGDLQIEVIQMDSIPNADDANAKCHSHLCFKVADMDEVIAAIKAWGLEMTVEPYVHEDRKVALFRGPCNEYTELNQFI